MKRIIIIEDDISLCRELQKLLKGAGYETFVLQQFNSLLDSIRVLSADMILLDIGLPALNGEEILRRLRKESNVPVVIITSRTNEADEVLSMSYGADDYITKPYNPTILLLRIEAIFRRTCGNQTTMEYGDMKISLKRGILKTQEKEILLTKNELIVFEQLVINGGAIVNRDVLMTALWDNEEYVNDNALTVTISRLRAKLADMGHTNAILTRKKQGYILQ